MKLFFNLFLSVFLSLSAFNVFAFDHAYNVSGVADSIGVVEGVAYTNDASTAVSGQLTDGNGDIHSYEGSWIGNGKISGITDDGDTVELNVTG